MARLTALFILLTWLSKVNGQIYYPNAGSINDSHVGDQVVVEFANPYKAAKSQLYYSYIESPQINKAVPAMGINAINLTLSVPASPNCYLQLFQDRNNLVTTPIFSIAPSNGTQTTWTSGSLHNGQVTPAAVSSAISQVTAPANGQPSREPRPEYPLLSDGSDEDYDLGNGTNCLDVSTSELKDQRCWNKLNLNEWLQTWFSKTPECSSSSSVNCQSQTPSPEAWTVTFLREYGAPQVDCLTLDAYCIDFPYQSGGGNEAPLSATRFEIALNLILTVLGVALSFIPAVGPSAGLGILSLMALNGVIAGVKQVPDAAKKIWPSGSENTIDFQIDTLRDLFIGPRGLQTQLTTNFGDTLAIVQGLNQSDPSAFLALAGQGLFSVPITQAPSVKAASPEQKLALEQSMTTFLVSEALAQNGWQALILPGVDGEGLHNGDKQCPAWAEAECADKNEIGCQSHDPTGLCHDSYWWYSVEQNSMYTLINDGKLGDDATEILQKIFDPSTSWTTGPLLFENAAICQLQNMLTQAVNQTYNYTTISTVNNINLAGFAYAESIPDLVQYQSQQETGFFVAINSTAFVALSQMSKYYKTQYHPLSTPFSIQPGGGVNPFCASNLNVAIANSWKTDNWSEHSVAAVDVFPHLLETLSMNITALLFLVLVLDQWPPFALTATIVRVSTPVCWDDPFLLRPIVFRRCNDVINNEIRDFDPNIPLKFSYNPDSHPDILLPKYWRDEGGNCGVGIDLAEGEEGYDRTTLGDIKAAARAVAIECVIKMPHLGGFMRIGWHHKLGVMIVGKNRPTNGLNATLLDAME
ncbi:MAG: hypothetical protein Q9213_003470 [Squamulea squamosa]